MNEEKKHKRRNIALPQWQPFVWDPAQTQECLQKLCSLAEQHAEAAIAWYYKNKVSKSLISRSLRLLIILATAAGGLLPLANSLGMSGSGNDVQRLVFSLRMNQYGYLCFGLAALCLALDRYFGFSSGWMRYIAAAMSLETALARFRFSWAKATAPFAGSAPAGEPLQSLVQTIADFVVAVRAIVEKETQDWIAEFQANLAQLEKDTKTALESTKAQIEDLRKQAETQKAAPKSADIILTVENLPAVVGGYDVTIDGKVVASNVTDRQCALRDIEPGRRSFEVRARLAGAPGHAVKLIDVTAGAVAEVALTLSESKS